MKLPAYPKYKPSGVEWLGDVPEKWEVKRLKTSATCWVSNVDKVPAEDELPVRLCNYTDVYYYDHITPDMDLMETTATADEIRRFGLREGDVVITKDSEEWSDIAVPALVKKSAPDLVCGYHLAIIRSRPKVLFGDYLLRAFQSCAINQQFQVAASGVTRYGLPKASIGDAWIPLPDTDEQQVIADFLDRETARLNALVAKKQKLIERLKEKRIALISRTVTRGLNPKAKLKPSGIAWLGDIPKHWDVKQLKHLGSIVSGNAFDSRDFTSSGIRVLKIANIQTLRLDWSDESFLPEEFYKEYQNFAVSDGDVVFALTRPIISTGLKAAIAKIGNERILLNQRNALFRPRPDVNRDFFYHALFCVSFKAAFETQIDFTGQQPNISPIDIGNIKIPVPSLIEQTAIAVYLDAETKKLDALVAKVETAVERLQEYRDALITAAVTGKIDVRKESHGK